MGSFKVEGGQRLKGELVPQGAKNEALRILCAVLLTAEPVTIHNVPDIEDVNHLRLLLQEMGVVVETLGKRLVPVHRGGDRPRFHAGTQTEAAQWRACVGASMLAGPLLGRFGKAAIPSPGGDKIGRQAAGHALHSGSRSLAPRRSGTMN